MPEKKIIIKIMVFGTFDGLHLGHLNFFKQARDEAEKSEKKSFLVVSVARDTNVARIKGKRPLLSEKSRMLLIKKTKLVDKVILGGTKEHLAHIIKEGPDIIALGYDQSAYVKNLKSDLKKKGLLVKVVRLKPYKENIYKNSILNHPLRLRSKRPS